MENNTQILKDNYIVILKGSGGGGFFKNYIYKQRENCYYIRPYYDSKGSKNNGWNACSTDDKSKWRYATDPEIALYDITDRPENISHVSKKASILYYLGRKFTHKDGNLLYTIDSHYSFPEGEVNITWNTINNAMYSAERVVNNFKTGTWVLQEFPETGYCMHLSTEFIGYMAEKCNSGIRCSHSDYKGIAWDEHDYWFIQSLSPKTEYKWEYIKQFINNKNENEKSNEKSNKLHQSIKTKGQQREEGLYLCKRIKSITVSNRLTGNPQSISRRKTKIEKSIIKGQPKFL